jgi:TPR repeat protein
MIRTIVTAAFVLSGTMGPSFGQENDDFAAMLARQAFIEGRTEEAYRMALPLAEKGVPRAQTIMGFLHETGAAPDASPEQALAWYEKAAAQGQPQGLHNLAYHYQNGGLGLPVDLEKARALYTQAAAMDFGSSVHNLAQMVLKGEGGPQDTAVALALYERAVTLGDPNAIADYAYVLSTGDGLPADLPRARQLYSIAAAYGVDYVQRDYADMMELGEGGPVDIRRALEYYRLSAAQGYGMAAFDIFELYRANPEALADIRIEALTMCFYAEAQPPQWDGSEYDGKCDPSLSDYTPEEIEAARAAAAAM